MDKKSLTYFETALGRCGLAWDADGVLGVQLPEATKESTEKKLRSRYPGFEETSEPDTFIAKLCCSLALHIEGKVQNFTTTQINMLALSPFSKKVYDGTSKIPPGETISYGTLAGRIGMPKGARAVGRALGANPVPLLIPCHRVVAADGALTGFSAAGGVNLKERLLEVERMSSEYTDGFLYDPARAAAYLRGRDEKLAHFIDKIGLPSMATRKTSTVFIALARTIVGQQLSTKAAATIFERFCKILPRGQSSLTPKNYLALTEPSLRSVGLSRNKIAAIRDLAERILSKRVPSLSALRGLSDAQVIEVLSSVKGIGKWTAEMVLMFRLGRPDVLSVDDLGLRLGHAIMIRKGRETDRKILDNYGERWRPYRSVASWYLWRILDLSREKPNLI
jgi:methylated-DNA-[protein]-cysteine S-methyltransferase